MVKHKTLLKNMKTPCTCNGDGEGRHPNFIFSVTSIMLHNLLERHSLLLQVGVHKMFVYWNSAYVCVCVHVHTHTHTQYVLQYRT
jgi:hypothetical protein